MTGGDNSELKSFHVDERRHRRRSALAIAILVLGPAGWITVREVQVRRAKQQAQLTPAQAARLTEVLDGREALSRENVARWNAVARRAVVTGLTSGDGDCPVKLTPPSRFSGGAYVKYATHDAAFGGWSLCILRADSTADACDLKYLTPPELSELRARVAWGDVYTWDLDEAKAAPPREEQLRTLVAVDTELPARVHSAVAGRLSFVPGALSAHAYLYSPAHGRFICAGTVSVRNSKTVDIEYSHFGEDPSSQQAQAVEEGRVALERDLEVQLRFALPGALRALQPP